MTVLITETDYSLFI